MKVTAKITKSFTDAGKLKAFATVCLADAFLVTGVRVVACEKGITVFIVDTPVEEHSKKPDIVREKIVELAGDLPRAELFARNEYPGWVCVGNEIDGMDIRDSLRMLKER